MKILERRGDFLVGMVLATVLFLVILTGLFEMQSQSQEITEQNYAIEELAQVGRAVQAYIDGNRNAILNDIAAFARTTNNPVVLDNNATMVAGINRYLTGGKTFADLRNIWGDSYHAVFIRSKNPAETANTTRTDVITCFVFASGQAYRSKHRENSTSGDKWLQGGARRAVLRGGSSFGFVETVSGTKTLRGTGFQTTLGLGNAHNGDLAYLVTYNLEHMASQTLMRYPTGDDEDQTMHADVDMNDNNLLNVQYIEAQTIDTGTVRFDPTLYDDAAEAENSCHNNWFYIKNKDFKNSINKLFVDSQGNIYSSWTAPSGNYQGTAASKVGTLGMNMGQIAQRRHADGTVSNRVDNVGRVYYISPKSAYTPGNVNHTDNTRLANKPEFAMRPQLAVCRVINGQKTLAYVGDNRSEDKIAFVVTAVDGDFIPPFYCPGQDANVQGGGTGNTYNVLHVDTATNTIKKSNTGGETLFSSGRNSSNASNNQGIMPRLFIMPQIVSSGKKAFPLQGIKAWAETVNTDGTISNGWIVRLNALIDVQKGKLNQRSYWVGNIPRTSQSNNGTNIRDLATDTSAGYMSLGELQTFIGESGGTSVDYLRAVVIGVCSGKLSTF